LAIDERLEVLFSHENSSKSGEAAEFGRKLVAYDSMRLRSLAVKLSAMLGR
jgi:hypothetical protein